VWRSGIKNLENGVRGRAVARPYRITGGTTMTNHRPQRRSPRLQGYDYTRAGAYFITICTQNRVHLFGDVVDGEMVLNTLGCIVETCWDDLPNYYNNIRLDAFVVMPNHIHGIIFMSNDAVVVGEGFKPSPTKC
jgi:hypothetical protein